MILLMRFVWGDFVGMVRGVILLVRCAAGGICAFYFVDAFCLRIVQHASQKTI